MKDDYEYNTVGVATWGHMLRKLYLNIWKIHNHISFVCQDNNNNNPESFSPDEVPSLQVSIAFKFVENLKDSKYIFISNLNLKKEVCI